MEPSSPRPDRDWANFFDRIESKPIFRAKNLRCMTRGRRQSRTCYCAARRTLGAITSRPAGEQVDIKMEQLEIGRGLNGSCSGAGPREECDVDATCARWSV